jgi:hypothetical protein
MRFRTQAVAYPYFVVALLLYGLQMAFGLLSAAKYLGPDPIKDWLPFDVSKAIHTNLLIVWVLTGFMGAESGWLLDTQGQPPKKKVNGDAESITALPDGSFLVAYENKHRLWLYKQPPAGNPLEQPAVAAGAPAGIAKLPRNGGIEAMARLPSGEYLLLSESGVTDDGDRRGWIGRRGKWAELRLAPLGSFEPSDLALLPDGNLLLLERRVSLLEGFVNRLSLIEGAAVKPGAVLQPQEIALLSAPLSVDNFEAAAARQAPDGSTLIYVLSDDNQRLLQRTVLLQFRLKN